MKSSDVKFLEAFKRLEAACNERFSCQSGVSEYIARMERADARGRAVVPDWAADYKALKHLRWVRNQLAHDPNAEALSKPEELKQLQDFTGRVQAKKDPLMQLENAGKSKAKASKSNQKSGKAKPNKKSHAGVIILLIVLVLLGLGFLFLKLTGKV